MCGVHHVGIEGNEGAMPWHRDCQLVCGIYALPVDCFVDNSHAIPQRFWRWITLGLRRPSGSSDLVTVSPKGSFLTIRLTDAPNPVCHIFAAPAASVHLPFTSFCSLKEVGRQSLRAVLRNLLHLVKDSTIALVIPSDSLQDLAATVGCKGATHHSTSADVAYLAQILRKSEAFLIAGITRRAKQGQEQALNRTDPTKRTGGAVLLTKMHVKGASRTFGGRNVSSARAVMSRRTRDS